MKTAWKILIIDDDEDDFVIARDMLKEARGRKFDIHWASTFAAGREELNSDAYHAVLVDYDLGSHSGIELIREASQRGTAAPLILFTGRGSYEVDLEALEAGATLYLTKSEANPLLLERAIRYAIELKQRELALRESEAALRASEAKERAKLAELNAVMDAVPAIVWVTHDAQAEEVTGNRAAHEFLRVPAGKNLSKSAAQDAPRNFKVYREGRELAPQELPLQISAATGQVIRNYEEEVRFEDGERAYLLGNVTPLLDEDGKPCGAVGAFLNITEREQAEAAILESRAKLEAALASIQDAVFISDTQGNFIEFNEAFATFHRFASKAECAKTLAEYPDFLDVFFPDGTLAPLDMWAVPRALRGETATNAEYGLRRKDTGQAWVGSYSFGPIRDVNGEIVGSVVVGRDITESKQAQAAIQANTAALQAALAEAEHGQMLLEALLENIPEGISITGGPPDFPLERTSRYGLRITRNPENPDLNGKPAGEHQDAWGIYLADGETRPAAEQMPLYRAAHFGEIVQNEEMVIRLQNGERVSVLVNAAPFRDAQGQIQGAINAWRDVTESKRVEDALRAREATLRESENRLRDFLENTRDSVCFIGYDWRIRYANRRLAENLGLTAEALVGRHITEDFPKYLGTPIETNFRRAMEERAPVFFQSEGLYGPGWYDISVYPTHEGIALFAVDRTEAHRAELALQQSEERYRTFFDQLRETVTILEAVRDEQGQVIDWLYQDINQSGLQILGQPRDQLIGKGASQVLGAEALDRVMAEYCQVLETGAPTYHDTAYQDQHFLVSVSRIDANRVASIGLNITERERANAERRESEERYLRLFRSIDEGFCIIEVLFNEAQKPVDYRFLEVNPAFERQTGIQNAVGRRMREFAPLHKEHWFEIYGEIALTGVSRRFENPAAQLNHYYEVFAFRIGEPQEHKVAVLFNDISERKATEAALQRSIERERARAAELETLMDTVPAMIWIARDAQCREMTGNRYGYEFLKMWQGANISKTASAADLNQQPYRNFKDGREIPTEELPMQIAASTGQAASNYDFDLLFNDGTLRTVLGNVNPLFDDQGHPSGAVAAFMDITERREVEEQLQHYARELERSNQALQDFAFIASHDLQEPLRKIIMFGSSLSRSINDLPGETTAATRDYLARMQNAAERMQVMIKGLLDLSRVNTHGAGFAPVDLNQVVAEVVSDLEARIQAVDGQVEIGPLPTLEADALQMRQLFQNLIGNAIKFHRPGVPPRVRVSATLRQHKKSPVVELRVADNGIGLDPRDGGKIFQPFQRLHSRSEYEGTGLGLAICQKIVERHGGTIAVESTPGQGATFIISLPGPRAG